MGKRASTALMLYGPRNQDAYPIPNLVLGPLLGRGSWGKVGGKEKGWEGAARGGEGWGWQSSPHNHAWPRAHSTCLQCIRAAF